MSEKIGKRLENNEEYSQNAEENSTVSQKGIGQERRNNGCFFSRMHQNLVKNGLPF